MRLRATILINLRPTVGIQVNACLVCSQQIVWDFLFGWSDKNGFGLRLKLAGWYLYYHRSTLRSVGCSFPKLISILSNGTQNRLWATWWLRSQKLGGEIGSAILSFLSLLPIKRIRWNTFVKLKLPLIGRSSPLNPSSHSYVLRLCSRSLE